MECSTSSWVETAEKLRKDGAVGGRRGGCGGRRWNKFAPVVKFQALVNSTDWEDCTGTGHGISCGTGTGLGEALVRMERLFKRMMMGGSQTCRETTYFLVGHNNDGWDGEALLDSLAGKL